MYQQHIPAQVTAALQEDLNGLSADLDITAQLIPSEQLATGKVITRQNAVVCGVEWVNETFSQIAKNTTIEWQVKDGDNVVANQTLFTFSGPAREILTAERTALNFLQMLSATATSTQHYVNEIAAMQSTTKILDTRKTIPGLRLAQKYAVTCGGGQNHRIGLFDAYLIKENHIFAAGSIDAAVTTAKQLNPSAKVEVEVESLDELQLAMDAGADIVMLDNFTVEMTAQARKLSNGKVKLEASGNMDGEKFKAYAQLNIDYISIGGLTKHVDAIDLSMRFD
ncbi:carboxylating nicotinate-nucleotide diphosphorylase [Psychrosphaera sp. B3R10]|uniref:carboxylating nicotinate-nucleotide diphosphorylase n=1 Tax=unclassified Psychrosphaera TaxID=2641570 RepID=UPI001C081450|nr:MULTISPECIES: carboxylating nicotinate-nucleotide diphosphorylase [unclassified Psychrosphaera]MBU2882512.1 carboxylating nicotinate-nucleotide diphosphorylase [Psychrosphaera sp. I2R16]MBU2989470.1 carboxylating nicotinate-nucleotide diphosphorylase [Psychrosphaera sp. B3R10]